MDNEQQATPQIQRQIDLLERFSMPSWRSSRWLFSLPSTRAKLLFSLPALAVFALGLGLLGAVAWHGIAPNVRFHGPAPEGDRVILTLLFTSFTGVVWAGLVGYGVHQAWKAMKARFPLPSSFDAVRNLVRQARNEPALKHALERSLMEEGGEMLTQSQAAALQAIAKTLAQLRQQEKQRLEGLEALEGLGLVTAARQQLRVDALDSALPAPAHSTPQPRF